MSTSYFVVETKREFQALFPELCDQPEKFFEYFRMTPATFEYILSGITETTKKSQIFVSVYRQNKDWL